MPNTREGLDQLKQLGSQNTKYTYDYDPSLLERIPNKHADRDYFIKFNCPEFTSLCPKTGQPDFATIYISYIPDQYMVESKSLKLYLFSFRNHGDFPAAGSPSTRTATTAHRIPNGKTLPASVSCIMI